MLSLISSTTLVILFGYLNWYTRRRYFAAWTCGWLFFTLWVAIAFTFPDPALLPFAWGWLKLSFIGLSAVCLFWGSLRFTGRTRGLRELIFAVGLTFIWSYFSHFFIQSPIWARWPLYFILCFAGWIMGVGYFQRRLQQNYIGATLLAAGFILWGGLMAVFPRLEELLMTRTPAYGMMAIIQLTICTGMIVLMLEEMRGEATSLRVQVRTDAWLTHKLQKEIDLSENKYRHIFEHASDGIFIVDPSSLQILEVNHAAEAITGYSREELLQLRFVNLCSFLRDKEKEVAEDPSQMQKIFLTYGNVPLQRKDNNMVLIEGASSVMQNMHGPTLHLFLREVTERRRLEQQLRQAEKLSALGQLISGVAHELNNPLAVISGYAQLLAMRPVVDEKTRNDLLKIQRESERASKIVQNFLTFARKHPMEKANVVLNRVVDVALELMDYDLRASGVRLEKKYDPHLPEVFADTNQLEQVFLNIINNAVQAMEGSPREKMIKVHTASTATHVKLTIVDYGKGITPSILPKIFDPFFTTKEVGSGTGLGLSISYSIIKEHSGNITAENHPEGGAIFTIELPISHMKTPQSLELPMEEGNTMPDGRPTRTYQVLVVDDETAIQDVFAELLADYSCKVTGANNGLEAMMRIEEQNFDLMICDLKMPGMDGRRLYDKVKEVKPHLVKNFVFITGDTNSPRTVEFLQKTGNRWIMKPFNFREVEAVITAHLKQT